MSSSREKPGPVTASPVLVDSHVAQARTAAPHVFSTFQTWASVDVPRARGYPTSHRPEPPHPTSFRPLRPGPVSTSPVLVNSPRHTGQNGRTPCLLNLSNLGQCRRPLCTWKPHVAQARAAAPHVSSHFVKTWASVDVPCARGFPT